MQDAIPLSGEGNWAQYNIAKVLDERPKREVALLNETDKSGMPMFYEIVEAGREADLAIGPILLKKVEYSPVCAEELRREADHWQITERVEYTEAVCGAAGRKTAAGTPYVITAGPTPSRMGIFTAL